MTELLAHLFGDYVLQNHVMATRKTSSSKWAAIHVAFYTLPFLLLTWDWRGLAIISGTHFVIDRYQLAGYWVRFWGVGQEGWVLRSIREWRRENSAIAHCIDYPFVGTLDSARADFDGLHPPLASAPPFLAVWLTIIVDNTFHLLINHLVLVQVREWNWESMFS